MRNLKTDNATRAHVDETNETNKTDKTDKIGTVLVDAISHVFQCECQL